MGHKGMIMRAENMGGNKKMPEVGAVMQVAIFKKLLLGEMPLEPVGHPW